MTEVRLIRLIKSDLEYQIDESDQKRDELAEWTDLETQIKYTLKKYTLEKNTKKYTKTGVGGSKRRDLWTDLEIREN